MSAVKFTTIGDLLKGSPFDPSFHLGGTLTEEIFYNEFYVEPPSMKSFSKKLVDKLDNRYMSHVVTFVSGYAGNGKTTFLRTFIRDHPQYEHVYYAAAEWQKGDAARSRGTDRVMSMMRRNLADSEGIGKTIALVHANREALFREDFISPAFCRFLDERTESEAQDPAFIDQCATAFELEDVFAVMFIHLFEQAVPGKKTIVYFDNLDIASVEYIVSEFWEHFQYAVTTAERLATDRMFGGRIHFRNDFRFVFCLRDTNEAVLNAHVAAWLDVAHLSFSLPFDAEFYSSIVNRRLLYLEIHHRDEDILPAGGKFSGLVRDLLKDDYFHDVFTRLYNYDYRMVVTAIVEVVKELQQSAARADVTYGLRGIVLFGVLGQLFEANFLRDYLENARRKEGWCYIDRVMLTVLMNRSSYRRGIGESDHSHPYGLYNLVHDLKPLYDVKSILNSVVRCFLNHQQGWVHLVTVLNTNVDDREVFVTVSRLARLFEQASDPGNTALRNELNRITIRVNPAGFTLVRYILNHFEFYGHLVNNDRALFERPLEGDMVDGRLVYDFEKKLAKVVALVTEHTQLMKRFFDSHYSGVRVTGEDFPRSPYCFRHQGKARVAQVVGQSHAISLVTSHIDYIDHFRLYLVGRKPLIAGAQEARRVNHLFCDILEKYVELLFSAPDQTEALRLAERFLNVIGRIREEPTLST